ncbi:MAG: helix-turn-helix domain-containing protein [Bacteroidaceae bacterium]|nr:helix-turn-helix domain-containing protein [Bacteroidaceae bacterium]
MNKVIGRNLKALREANKFTQERIADYLGVKRSAYANYESGDREAPIDILEKACNLFGCSLDMLFSEDKQAVNNMLICAFRADGFSDNDMKEIATFKSVVMNYLKMDSLINNG